MSAHRKLSPEQEAAIINWYADYQKAMNELRKIGSLNQKAKELGIRKETVRVIANREEYSVRRKCRDAGIELKKTGTAVAQ